MSHTFMPSTFSLVCPTLGQNKSDMRKAFKLFCNADLNNS